MSFQSDINLNLVLGLLFIHWIADFVLQSDDVAKNKSKDNLILAKHCLIYGLPFAILCMNPIFGLVLALVHFPVDYITSRINSYLWKKGDVHNFFISVGFDQFIHFVTIIYLYRILG